MFPFGGELRAVLVKFLLKSYGWFPDPQQLEAPAGQDRGFFGNVRIRINSSD